MLRRPEGQEPARHAGTGNTLGALRGYNQQSAIAASVAGRLVSTRWLASSRLSDVSGWARP